MLYINFREELMPQEKSFKKKFYTIEGIEKNFTNLRIFLLAIFYVDLFDFHSNIKISKKFFISTPLIEVDSDITWTNDMFTIEDPKKIKKINEEKEETLKSLLPKFYVEKFDTFEDILYSSIIKFFRIKLYKNRKTSLFSEFGEDINSFKKRCYKMAKENYEEEIKNLRRVSEIKFEHLKEKFDRKEYINEFEREKVKDSFFEARKYLEKIFLSPEEKIKGIIPLSNEASQDLTQLIESITKKLREIIEEITRSSEDIEPYYISLSPKNISDFKVEILLK